MQIYQQGISHANVLALYNAGRSRIFKNGEAVNEDHHFYFVSELAPKGELFKYVYDH